MTERPLYDRETFVRDYYHFIWISKDASRRQYRLQKWQMIFYSELQIFKDLQLRNITYCWLSSLSCPLPVWVVGPVPSHQVGVLGYSVSDLYHATDTYFRQIAFWSGQAFFPPIYLIPLHTRLHSTQSWLLSLINYYEEPLRFGSYIFADVHVPSRAALRAKLK